MAEWNETAWWTQAKIPNYFDGRKGERREVKTQFSLYIIISVMVFKGWNGCIEPQSCPLLFVATLISRKSLALFGFRKKIKIITTKYFLSQLELLIQLQHSATGDSIWKLVSTPYRHPLDHLLLLEYFLLFLASLWRVVEMQVFSPCFYVANSYPKWSKGQTGG